MKRVGVLIYTFNRTDDAKINMEIIRNIWKKSGYFQNVKIVHSYNGKRKWHPKKYVENDLVTLKNSWHFQGAADLIDAGIKIFEEKYKNLDYIIVLASDTWLIDPNYLKNFLIKMSSGKFYLATCPWGLPKRNNIADVGMAVDFFVVDFKWAQKYRMFPVKYKDFHKKYEDLFLYQKGGNVMLEKLLFARYLRAVNREENFGGVARKKAIEKILFMKDREPVHSHIDKKGYWKRYMYWPKMGLLTHHEPAQKKKILKDKKIDNGENIKRLLRSRKLSYYNQGTAKMDHNCN